MQPVKDELILVREQGKRRGGHEELGVGALATAALMAASSELGLGLLGMEPRSELMRSWQGALLAVSVMASFTQSAHTHTHAVGSPSQHDANENEPGAAGACHR